MIKGHWLRTYCKNSECLSNKVKTELRITQTSDKKRSGQSIALTTSNINLVFFSY